MRSSGRLQRSWKPKRGDAPGPHDCVSDAGPSPRRAEQDQPRAGRFEAEFDVLTALARSRPSRLTRLPASFPRHQEFPIFPSVGSSLDRVMLKIHVTVVFKFTLMHIVDESLSRKDVWMSSVNIFPTEIALKRDTAVKRSWFHLFSDVFVLLAAGLCFACCGLCDLCSQVRRFIRVRGRSRDQMLGAKAFDRSIPARSRQFQPLHRS